MTEANNQSGFTPSPGATLLDAAEWCNCLAASYHIKSCDVKLPIGNRCKLSEKRNILWEAAEILKTEGEKSPSEVRNPDAVRIFAEARRQRAEIKQYFNDVSHWNNTRGKTEGIIDPDPDGSMRKIEKAIDDLLEQESSESNEKGQP